MSRLRLAGFAGLLVAAALVGGTIIGSVAAATAPAASASDPAAVAPSAGTVAAGQRAAAFCAAFRAAFAANLGVDGSALAPAAKAAAISTIDAAVAAGTLTKAAGERLTARVEAAAADGCALLAGRIGARAAAAGTPGSSGRPGTARSLGIVNDEVTAAAGALGITPAELGADLRAGRTLRDVATARTVPYDKVSAAVVASAKVDLDAAVAAGTIKAARADRILARLTAALADGRLRNARPAAPAPTTAPATAPATPGG
jgi:ribosomal protein S20